jgi:hypothetical protein
MKKSRFKSKLFLFTALIALIMVNTSCDREKLSERPDLPAMETFLMDFSDFENAPQQTKAIGNTYDNFLSGFGYVAFWNTVATITMAVPTAAYFNMLTVSGNPEYLGDSRWQWVKEYTVNQIAYKATLTAERINNSEFSMEMNIALAALPTLGVVWFDGVVSYDHTHAVWNLYKNDAGHVKYLEVEWNKNYETLESDLTYTYVEPGTSENGSYIKMGIVPGADYDAYYTISLVAQLVNIEWDRTSKAGRIMDPVGFEEEIATWHCWNDLLQDIDCPQ